MSQPARGRAQRRARFGWPTLIVAAISSLFLLKAFDSSAREESPRGRFTSPTPHTLFDSRTGLTWQRNVDEAACPPDACTWEKALNYCADLRLDGGGYRLPTRAEFAALSDTDVNHAQPSALATSTSEFFWNASATAMNASGGRYPTSVEGSPWISEEARHLRVRCVR